MRVLSTTLSHITFWHLALFIKTTLHPGVGERGVINGSHCQYKYKILLVDQAPGKL